MRVEVAVAMLLFVFAINGVGWYVFSRSRRHPAAELQPAASTAPQVAKRGPGAAPAQSAPEAILVSIPEHEDRFLVLGDVESLDGVLDSRPVDFLPEAQRLAAAQQAAGLVNVPLQGGVAAYQATHLVKLAPETVNALANGAKFMQVEGMSAGVMVGEKSKIVALAKFQSAGTLASSASAVGMAVTMVAIQMQLAAMDKKLDQIQRTVGAILAEDRLDREVELLSLAAAMQSAYGQARPAGEVTQRIMGDIGGKGQELDAHIRRLSELLQARLNRRLATGRAADVEQWFSDDGYQALGELRQLIVASRGWLMQRALYVAYLAASDSEADRQAAEVAWQQTEERRVEVDELVHRIHLEMRNALEFIIETPGRNTLKNVVVRKGMRRELTSDQVRRTALELREIVDAAGIRGPELRPLDAAFIGGRSLSGPERFERQLMRFLPSDETPILVVEGARVGKWGRVARGAASFETGVWVLTDRRLLAIRYSEFDSRGKVFAVLSRSDVQGVESKLGELHLRHREGKLVLGPHRGEDEREMRHTLSTWLDAKPAAAGPLAPVSSPRTLWEIEAA